MAVLPEHVEDVTGFGDLIDLLAQRLEWPLDEADLETITFDADLREVGIDPDVAGLQSVRQLRPLVNGQPWGIFLLHFERAHLPVTVLRKILRFFASKQRVQADAAGRATWPVDHILFVADHGVGDSRQFSFAHFDGTHARDAKLSVFGWTPGEPCRTLCEYNLPALEWPEDIKNSQAWLDQWAAAFDVEKVTARFFAKYAELFEWVKAEAQGEDLVDDAARHAFTEALFNRLLFITFIQKKRWLDGDNRYLFNRFDKIQAEDKSYFSDFLYWLFFWALPAPPEKRHETEVAEWTEDLLGDVPFLNGGLFDQMGKWDTRGHVHLDNEVFERVFTELLDHFNFTVTESTPLDIEVAIDPEMLGKVFEELVTGRHESGSYYTPKSVVAFMCREALKGHLGSVTDETPHAIQQFVDHQDPSDLRNPEAVLDALRAVTVCDPACGSGAYLLGMMQELGTLRTALFAVQRLDPPSSYRLKLDIIQDNLYGVDLDPFAVNIARLRLWLSLAVDYQGDNPPPLPNLDMKIEIGDSLSAPAPDFAHTLFRDRLVKDADQLADLKSQYLTSHGSAKDDLRAEIDACERELEDLFRDRPAPRGALDWRIAFAEVFTAGGFDIVVANPPYVRHELIAELKPQLESVFPTVYGGTADLYCYFYARATELLRPGGMLVFISSNKWLRADYGSNLRKHLAGSSRIVSITDFGSLPVFQSAIAYPMIFIAQKDAEQADFLFTDVTSLDYPYPDILAVIEQEGIRLPPTSIHLETRPKSRFARRVCGSESGI